MKITVNGSLPNPKNNYQKDYVTFDVIIDDMYVTKLFECRNIGHSMYKVYEYTTGNEIRGLHRCQRCSYTHEYRIDLTP